jgi:DNA polymerase-3 subunit beta
MHFSAERNELLSRLQVVARAVSMRSAIPALSGILLDAGPGAVRLAATDMELALQMSLPGKPKWEGSAIVPGRLLLDVVRSLPEGEVSIELREAERDVEIVAGASRFDLKALPASDFPKLPAGDGDRTLSLPGAALAETIDRVARAASRDEARPILTGVLVSADASTLTMVATDSYRLSVKSTELSAEVGSAFEANVPARALQELSRLIAAAGEEEVAIAVGENQVIFEVADAILSSRLIDGQFPNHQQLVPDSYEHEVRLAREEFLEAVRRIGLLAQKNAPLRLAFAEGELTVSAETPDIGQASESLPVNFQGEPFEIGFNPEFLREGVESMVEDELLFKLITPLRPGLLRPVEAEDFLYLIMPIRLNV